MNGECQQIQFILECLYLNFKHMMSLCSTCCSADQTDCDELCVCVCVVEVGLC